MKGDTDMDFMNFDNMANNIWFEAMDMDNIGTPEEEKQQEIVDIKQGLERLAVLEKEDSNITAVLGALYRIFDN